MDTVRRSGSRVQFRYIRVPKIPTIIDRTSAFYIMADVDADCGERTWRLARTYVVPFKGPAVSNEEQGSVLTIPANVLAGRELRMVCGKVVIPGRYEMKATMEQYAHLAPRIQPENDGR